ncbi:MAG: undecaprenyldiphospho-muramoylpentapeptide beta-N-acetylglucosaminyltransferase [bacterium]
MNIILAGGGTGGHLYPGVAIAQEFRRQRPDSQILFCITRRKIDQQIISEEGWRYSTLPVESFRGVSWRTVRALGGLAWSIRQAGRLVQSFHPLLIIGLGAYPSVPMIVAGKWHRVPLVIQEQNIFPGGANKMLARWAERVFISFAGTEKYFPSVPDERIILTGNPVRQAAAGSEGESNSSFRSLLGLEEGKFTLLIFGGSKGAHRINEAVLEGLAGLPKGLGEKLQIIHQTGQEDFYRVQQHYQELPVRATALPFIYRMMEAYQSADLVVCRAGATTVAEITLMGKAAIMIPYPYAVNDHQAMNAAELQKVGAAEMILERDLTGAGLWARIQTLMEHPQMLAKMQEESKRLGKPEAASRIVQECLKVVGEKSGVRSQEPE